MVSQLCLMCGSTLNCQTLCLGARPRYSLVVDEDVKKPTNQPTKSSSSSSSSSPPQLYYCTIILIISTSGIVFSINGDVSYIIIITTIVIFLECQYFFISIIEVKPFFCSPPQLSMEKQVVTQRKVEDSLFSFVNKPYLLDFVFYVKNCL